MSDSFTGDLVIIASLLVILAALAAASVAAPTARREAERVVQRTRPHTSTACGAGGALVPEPQVSSDGHLYGLCPGCGRANVSCSIVDPNLPFGPWVIDDHEPRIDPDFGLHEGQCWANKTRSGDFGLCACEGVAL